MNTDPQDSLVDQASLADVSYDRKWEILKPAIELLYVQENKKLKDVIAAIRDQCGFAAVESQYKYQIKKWGLKKNIPDTKKADVCKVVKNRAQHGKSSLITRDGRSLERKQLTRYIKKETRKTMALDPVQGLPTGNSKLLSGRAAQFGNMIFMNWNMPYGLLKTSASRSPSHPSPLSDIIVATPPAPKDAPSPLTVAIKALTAVDRARLLIHGRHDDMLKMMDKQQKITISTWLYQFWLFSFKTAKHWGRGPRAWTADILEFDRYQSGQPILASSSSTPADSAETPGSQHALRAITALAKSPNDSVIYPTSLCRWSIHYRSMIRYQALPERQNLPPTHIDLDDERSWPEWPAAATQRSLPDTLSNGLGNSRFTTVSPRDLPLAMNQVVQAVHRSPQELRKEALGFSIMSRNMPVLYNLLDEIYNCKDDINGLYPFHLVAAYLDGAKTCCNILRKLAIRNSIRKCYRNELGHTVLDQLMLTILKAHTSCRPHVADEFFKRDKVFEGEDVDICGRWDADSPCVRKLLATGDASIPFRWKHVFCHTSVQAICHCIGTLFSLKHAFDINEPSGLFTRRCSHCGLKLQLLPLHTLIVVGYYLSQSGCKDETLFGILACLLCLLSNGADSRLEADISLHSISTSQEDDQCTHRRLDPIDFASAIINRFGFAWSKEIRTTWNVISYVLKRSRAEWKSSQSRVGSPTRESMILDEFDSFITYDEDEAVEADTTKDAGSLPTFCDCSGDRLNFFGGQISIATLWAATKTELLTYRRLREGDPWLSPNFDMNALSEGLHNGGKVAIPLVEQNMMRSFCQCGRFYEGTLECTVADEACAHYFSNMDDWYRTTFIECPDR